MFCSTSPPHELIFAPKNQWLPVGPSVATAVFHPRSRVRRGQRSCKGLRAEGSSSLKLYRTNELQVKWLVDWLVDWLVGLGGVVGLVWVGWLGLVGWFIQSSTGVAFSYEYLYVCIWLYKMNGWLVCSTRVEKDIVQMSSIWSHHHSQCFISPPTDTASLF